MNHSDDDVSLLNAFPQPYIIGRQHDSISTVQCEEENVQIYVEEIEADYLWSCPTGKKNLAIFAEFFAKSRRGLKQAFDWFIDKTATNWNKIVGKANEGQVPALSAHEKLQKMAHQSKANDDEEDIDIKPIGMDADMDDEKADEEKENALMSAEDKPKQTNEEVQQAINEELGDHEMEEEEKKGPENTHPTDTPSEEFKEEYVNPEK